MDEIIPQVEATPTVQVANAAGEPAQQAGILASAAVLTRTRGRHKKDCVCERCVARRANPVQPGNANTKSNIIPLPVPLSEQERKLAAQAILALTHTVDTTCQMYFGIKLRKAVLLEPQQKQQILQTLPMKTEIRDGIVTTGVAVAEKYGWARLAPEIALGGYCLTYLYGIAQLSMMLNEFIPQEKKKNEPKTTSKESAQAVNGNDGKRQEQPNTMAA